MMVLLLAPASIAAPAPVPKTILSESNVKALNEPDITNEPVISASPTKGKGLLEGRFVKPEPSPSNEPENEPENPSVTIREPDITELAFEIKPFFIINSFSMFSFFPYPKRS